MKTHTMQIEAGSFDNNAILKAGGVRRIHDGWYTCHFNGMYLEDRKSVV